MAYYDNVAALNPLYWFKLNEASSNNGAYGLTNNGSVSATSSLVGFGTNLYQGETGILNNCVRYADAKYHNLTTAGAGTVFDDRTFSIEVWHKPYSDNSGSGFQIFGVDYNPNNPAASYLYINYDGTTAAGGNYYFGLKGGTGYPVNTVTSNNVAHGGWHHIVVTFTPSAIKMYVDGSLHATTNNPNIPNSLSLDSKSRQIGYGFIGYVDELAVYPTELTANQVFNNYDIMYNGGYSPTVVTASALLPMPAVAAIRNPNNTASVMTASSTFPEAIQSARDNFTLLDTYLKTLSLEQYYKFDEPKAVTNYGTGGLAAWTFQGNSRTDITSGVQGNGALRFNGGTTNTVSTSGSAPYSTEITDSDFSFGFWVKKSAAEVTGILFFQAATTGEYYELYFNGSGHIVSNAQLQNQAHSITAATNYADGNWHYVAARMSGTTMQLWVDNVSKGTVTINHSFSAVSKIFFGNTTSSATELMYVSNFYIAPSSVVTSTEIGNIWTYGQPTVQGGAAMPMPKFSRNNAFNDYIEGKSPIFYFKMDEGTGVPVNYGSEPITLVQQGTNVTKNVTSPNYKAYNTTDRDTYFAGSWAAASGTFSSANQQTVVLYAKITTPLINLNGLVAVGYNGGSTGNGVYFQGVSNGNIRFRTVLSNVPNVCDTTTSYSDGNYHMFVGVKDGSTLKLYIDGVLITTNSSATQTLTDSGVLAIAGVPGTDFSTTARNVTIDEFAVFNTAFSAQDAFEVYQKIALVQDTTATALMVQPAASLGFGPVINPGVATASALLPDATQLDTIAPTIDPMTVTAMFQMPNFAATKNTNNAAAVMTASATGENPAVTAGGVVGVLHMNAAASFPEAKARIPGVWNADPFTVSAEMVQPGLATTKGGLVKPQSLNASAQLPLPPAYFTIADDRWYQRLLLVDYQSSNFNGVTTFFNTSTDIVRGGGFGAWNAIDQRSVFQTYYGYNLTDSPLPVAYAGTYDPQNRKALRIRNIALTASDGYANTGANWTFETYIKTTKKNQILFVGKQLADTTSASSQSFNAAWRLRDGKISLNNAKSLRSGTPDSSDLASFTGFKDIADGEWHHIIIQFRNTFNGVSDRRAQVFIDGELDIQRYGYDAYPIHQIGYNSADINSYSDFETSAVASNQGSFVLERETHLNYFSCVGIIPVEAATATASATLTDNNKGRGNRGRALMLYFWPTHNVTSGEYKRYMRSDFSQYGNGYTDADQGIYGDDPDTFYQLTTWIKNGANKFYDWDMWPLAVVSPPTGDDFPADTHPILKDGVIDTSGGYRDPVTNNPRYINLMEDLKDLSQFDMICFRNYPDDSGERDVYGTSAKGVTDEYFNVLDKDLFEEFLKSLRDAVDSGISLLVTNPQLAVDMGFIDTYHTVDALDGAGNETFSDEYTPIKLKDPLGTGSPVLNIEYLTVLTQPGRSNEYQDYYRNNYHQVVNTIPGLTDDPAYIWKDEVHYKTDGLEYGELGRVFSHIEYNAGLQPGDKFLVSSMINAYAYHAVPLDAVKAGKVITKFADTYFHGSVERVNPYRNYATSIAIEPGTVVAGKQIGAKVFISFTDNVGVQKSLVSSYLSPGSNSPIEERLVELKSDYWIDYAFSTGSISESERTAYKANVNNIDRLYPNGGATANALKYWTLNGQNIIGSANGFDDGATGLDTSESVNQGKKVAKTRAGMRRRNTVSTSDRPQFGTVSSWLFPIISVPVPNINTRALWWLSERLAYETLPQRPLALDADAFMPQPVITGYKVASINAQPALASATIVETSLRSGTLSINSAPLPLTATATLVPLGLSINPGVATASARLTTNFSTVTSKDDDIVLYVIHEDPILYIREDAIK